MVAILISQRVGQLGYVKQRASTKAEVSPADFEALKNQFLFDVKIVVEMEDTLVGSHWDTLCVSKFLDNGEGRKGLKSQVSMIKSK